MSRKRKTRSVVLHVSYYGFSVTKDGFDLIRWRYGTQHVVHVRFDYPSNAEELAMLSLNWIDARRATAEHALERVKSRLNSTKP